MLKEIYLSWRDLMDNKSDPRTTNWPLMASPIPTIIICLTYVYIVKVKKSFPFTFGLILFACIFFSDFRAEIHGEEKAIEVA